MATQSDTSVCSYAFFTTQATNALATAYAVDPILFIDRITSINFTSQGIIITNDAAGSIFFSYDGVGEDGEVKAGESFTFDHMRFKQIWIRGAAGGESYRFWAW